MPKSSSTRERDVAGRVLRPWHDALPDDRIAHVVKEASRAFVRSLQARLVAHDVPIGHWTFLRVLWERDGLTQRELSIEAGVMEPTTLVALRSMQAQGYITRERLGENRKNLHVYLTPLGRRLKRKLVLLAEQVNALALAHLSAVEVAATQHSLLTIIDNLTRDPALAASARTRDEPTAHAAASTAEDVLPAGRRARRPVAPR